MVRLAVTFGVYIMQGPDCSCCFCSRDNNIGGFFFCPFHLGLGGHLALAAHFEDNLN